jgi:hypothetical protein
MRQLEMHLTRLWMLGAHRRRVVLSCSTGEINVIRYAHIAP